jgi:hypothetical protein
VESSELRLLKKRAGRQRFARAAPRDLRRRGVGHREDQFAILCREWVGRVAIVPHQNYPAAGLQDAVEFGERGLRLEPVK